MKWVVGVSDAESWLPFGESRPFDNASAALTWVEDYLRAHPDVFGNNPVRGFTCKRMQAEALLMEGPTALFAPAAGVAGLQDQPASTFAQHSRAGSSLLELASLGA